MMTWPPSTSAAVVRHSTLGGLVLLSQCCTAATLAPPGAWHSEGMVIQRHATAWNTRLTCFQPREGPVLLRLLTHCRYCCNCRWMPHSPDLPSLHYEELRALHPHAASKRAAQRVPSLHP